MPRIIIDRAISESDFTVVDAETADINSSNVILPLAVWQENKAALEGRNDIGIWLDADEEVEEISEIANQFPVIALNFPTFFDGRSLSSANMLRRKYGFTGELRAIGDVRRDQMDQMQRCGFNAFEPAEGQDFDAAMKGLSGFTYKYQNSIEQPEPLFRAR